VVAGERGVQQSLVRFGRFAQLADERGVQVDRAPGLLGQRGQLQPQARVRVDPQHDLVGSALVGRERKAMRLLRSARHEKSPLEAQGRQGSASPVRQG